jgi:hypothetical protein
LNSDASLVAFCEQRSDRTTRLLTFDLNRLVLRELTTVNAPPTISLNTSNIVERRKLCESIGMLMKSVYYF